MPSTLVGVEGIQLEFKNYVIDAWREIQMERRDWYFKQAEQSIDIDNVALTDGMRVPTSLINSANSRSWNFIHLYDVFVRLRNDNTDQPSRIYFVPWNNWNDSMGRSDAQLNYNDGQDIEDRPRYFTIAPTGELWLNPIPDLEYEMQFFGPTAVQELSADSDTPTLPTDYHDMIVWRAVREYGMYHNDTGTAERARVKYMFYKKLLDEEYLPHITLDTNGFYEDC